MFVFNPRPGQFLAGLVILYCVGVATLAMLWLVGVSQPWWVVLTNIFALYFFSPLLLLIPVAVVTPSRRVRVAVAGLLLLFLVLFGPQFLPSTGHRPAGRSLRVMTFNLQHTGQTQDVVSLIELIQRQDPDIVALQEVSEEVQSALNDAFGTIYPHQLVTLSSLQTSLVLLSRYPFESRQPSLRRSQLVVIIFENRPVSLMNVSLPTPEIETRPIPGLPALQYISNYTTGQRSEAIARLLYTIDSNRGPLIALGDFNLSDREAAYAQFDRRLYDAYQEAAAGFGFTFPHNKRFGPVVIPFPLIRIDYVWSKEPVLPTSVQVVCKRYVSDHCAVVANLRLTDH